jgi:hypothetical protein
MTREEGPLKWGLVCLLSSLVKVAFFEVHTKSRSRSEIFPVTNPATVSLTLPRLRLVFSVRVRGPIIFDDHTISNLVFAQISRYVQTALCVVRYDRCGLF